MKKTLLCILVLACTLTTAGLIAKPKISLHNNSAQAVCQPGDAPRNCWHYLEHRQY